MAEQMRARERAMVGILQQYSYRVFTEIMTPVQVCLESTFLPSLTPQNPPQRSESVPGKATLPLCRPRGLPAFCVMLMSTSQCLQLQTVPVSAPD